LSIQNKERILKAATEKCQDTNKGKSIRIAALFLKRNFKMKEGME
jgi:hypothetical protein